MWITFPDFVIRFRWMIIANIIAPCNIDKLIISIRNEYACNWLYNQNSRFPIKPTSVSAKMWDHQVLHHLSYALSLRIVYRLGIPLECQVCCAGRRWHPLPLKQVFPCRPFHDTTRWAGVILYVWFAWMLCRHCGTRVWSFDSPLVYDKGSIQTNLQRHQVRATSLVQPSDLTRLLGWNRLVRSYVSLYQNVLGQVLYFQLTK